MKKLISPLDLTTQEIDELLALADRIIEDPQAFAHKCDGKILATLFFEPSTRTRLSFESAMLSLGGKVLGFSSANSSSAAKGESVADTVRTVECYADIIAMRHPKEGAATVAASKVDCPLINAGDGGHQHPTQTLTDLLTIHRLKGHLNNLTVGLCGDLKFGRTVHSLIRAMMRYENIKFVLVSPKELQVPDYIRDDLVRSGYEFEEVERLEDAIGKMDILYMTRAARALLQRGGLHPPAGQLHPGQREDEAGQRGHDRHASPAPRQRDQRGGGRRPPRRLLPSGEVRALRAHGPYPENAGGGVNAEH